jgi:hypothetical protein
MQQIPLIDIRETGPLALLESHALSARELIRASRTAFGPLAHAASYPAASVGDALVKRWLKRANNPYAAEIAGFAKYLKASGVYALNLIYEFGCTSGVYASSGGPRLLRVLDWPFRRLGEHLVVARQKGPAGEFHNATWPAVSGVYTAMAKGRFAVALNQAPMRRHRGGIYRDWLTNRRMVWRSNALPPAHLLRKVCETAKNYEEAKAMLLKEPIAIPVIYILAGTKPGEGCVIERLEQGAGLREIETRSQVSAGNHFLTHLNGIGHGWMARAIDSCGRGASAGQITPAAASDPEMRWYKPPIANIMSRVCFAASAATGEMSLMGVEGEAPVTGLFTLRADAMAA